MSGNFGNGADTHPPGKDQAIKERIKSLSSVTIGSSASSPTAEQLTASYRKLVRKSKRRFTRYGLLAGNVVLVAIVGYLVLFGDKPAIKQADLSVGSVNDAPAAIDEYSAADIAANVAQLARLDEAPSVQNQADSFRAQLTVAPADSLVVAKPQLVHSSDNTKSWRDIQQYTVVAGDTISAIATKFNVTSDSIRWSNNISGEAVAVGKVLWVPPRNGIVYEVKSGDTPDTVAAKFRANKEQIIAFNDAEVGGLKVGAHILVPDGVQAPTRTTYSYYYANFTAAYGSNGYTYGYCTWWAAKRRAEIGRPIPTNLGNAITWFSLARAAGLPTGDKPQAGAVAWYRTIGGLGHVGFVEKVDPDGTALISDMNYPYWNRTTYHTITPAEYGNFGFIY